MPQGEYLRHDLPSSRGPSCSVLVYCYAGRANISPVKRRGTAERCRLALDPIRFACCKMAIRNKARKTRLTRGPEKSCRYMLSDEKQLGHKSRSRCSCRLIEVGTAEDQQRQCSEVDATGKDTSVATQGAHQSCPFHRWTLLYKSKPHPKKIIPRHHRAAFGSFNQSLQLATRHAVSLLGHRQSALLRMQS